MCRPGLVGVDYFAPSIAYFNRSLTVSLRWLACRVAKGLSELIFCCLRVNSGIPLNMLIIGCFHIERDNFPILHGFPI